MRIPPLNRRLRLARTMNNPAPAKVKAKSQPKVPSDGSELTPAQAKKAAKVRNFAGSIMTGFGLGTAIAATGLAIVGALPVGVALIGGAAATGLFFHSGVGLLKNSQALSKYAEKLEAKPPQTQSFLGQDWQLAGA